MSVTTTTAYRCKNLIGGYQYLRWPGHPIANAQGGIAEHRAVFYEFAGPGPHECYWCGRTLVFGPGPAFPTADDLVVDHVDADKLNNDPVNLVPSCNVCNLQRGMHAARVAGRRADRLAAAGGDHVA